jgi:excisionase family DNA binding protein
MNLPAQEVVRVSVVDSPIFTVLEAAAYLKIPETTLLLHLRRGTFAYKRVGKRYLIQRAEVEQFARTGFKKQGVR